MKQLLKAIFMVLLVSVLALSLLACDYDFGTKDVEITFTDSEGNVVKHSVKIGEALTEYTIPEAPEAPEDMYFQGWFTEDGVQITVGFIPTEGFSAIAKFDIMPPTAAALTFEFGGATEVRYIVVGKQMKETDFPTVHVPEGMTFDGWYIGEEKIEAGYEVKGDVTIVAELKNIMKEVTFVIDGEETVLPVKINSVLTEDDFPTVPGKINSYFVGWFDGDNEVKAGYRVTEDVTLTAQYEKYVVVTFMLNGAALPRQIKPGAALAANNFPGVKIPEHQTFVGWFVGEQKIEAGYVPTENVTAVAVFEDITFRVDFVVGGQKTSVTLKEGTVLTAKDFPEVVVPEHQHFVGWYSETQAIGAGYEVLANVQIEAIFANDPSYDAHFIVNGVEVKAPKIVYFEGEAIAEEDFPEITVPAHQIFKGWYVGETKIEAGFVPTAEFTVVAVFEDIMKSITYQVGEETEVVTLKEGTILLALPEVAAPEHQRFVGWFIGEQELKVGYELLNDVVAVAQFEDILVTINFVAGSETSSLTVKEGTALTAENFPAVELPSYQEFAGWFVNGVQIEAGYEVTANVTAVAKINDIVIVVTFIDNGESIERKFTRGDLLTARDFPTYTTPAHQNFIGWFIGETKIEAGYEVTENVTITAMFEDILFQVSFVDQGETVKQISVKEGDALAAEDFPANQTPEHFDFLGWRIGETPVEAGYVIWLDTVITATYKAIPQYTVIFAVGEEQSQSTFYRDDVLTAEDLPAVTAPAHKTFAGWFVGEDEVGAGYVVTGNVTFTAKFEDIVFTLTFVDGENSIEKQFVEGTILTAEDIPQNQTPAHHTFEGWYAGEVKIEAGYEVVSDLEITAVYAPINFTVSFVYNEEEIVSDQLLEGTMIELPTDVVIPEHYTFEGWFLGDDKVEESFELTEDVELVAVFKEFAKFDVTLVVKGVATVLNIYDGDQIAAEDVPAITLTDNEIFEGWFIEDEQVEVVGYTVTGAVTIVAAIENRGETPVLQIVQVTFLVGENSVVKNVAKGAAFGDILYTPDAGAGLKFMGWKYNGEAVDETAIVAGGEIFEAVFDENVYYVTFVIEGESSRVKVAMGYAIDANKIPEIPAKEDYRAVGFFANGVAFDTTKAYDEDVTFTAVYEVIYYYVTFVNGEEVVATQKILISENSALAEVPADAAAEGKFFVGYYNGDVKAAAGVAITADTIFAARFVTFPEGLIGTHYLGEQTVVIGPASISIRGIEADEIVYDEESDCFLFTMGDEYHVLTEENGVYYIDEVALSDVLPEDIIPESPIVGIN